MKNFILIVLVLLVGFLISCSEGSDRSVSGLSEMNTSMAVPPLYAPERKADGYSSTVVEPKIQINGSLSMEVQNVSDSVEKTQTLVSQYNGRVTSSDSGDSEIRYANITVLVPKESFYQLLGAIKSVATKVISENINSHDVTEEFIDVEARLNVMKQTENRFLLLLPETTDIEEIISVERELMRIRGEIDSFEGRLKYLSRTTDNSILNIHMVEELQVTGGGWSFFDSLDNSVRSLVSFSKNIANVLIGLVVFSPILIVAGVLLFFGYKLRVKYKGGRT